MPSNVILCSTVCTKNVRLANGTDSSGRVEVCYSGTWGTVCDDEWDITDATVVCKELGFVQALAAYRGGFYGAGNGDILMDNVQCNGMETSLVNCTFKGWTINDCSHDNDAGVLCGGNKLPYYNLNIILFLKRMHLSLSS